MKRSTPTLLAAVAACVVGSAASAAVVYSDDFNDNTNTGWTYLDRSGGTAIVTGVGGGPGAPSFVEQNGQTRADGGQLLVPERRCPRTATAAPNWVALPCRGRVRSVASTPLR